MARAIIAYIPVLHQGYIDLLKNYPGADLYILGPDVIAEYDWLRKDLRAVEPSAVAQAVGALHVAQSVSVAGKTDLTTLAEADNEIVMPDEDVSHAIAEVYFTNHQIRYDPIFLRWDRRRSSQQDPPTPDETMSESEFDQELMARADNEKGHSSNIWRRVGALVFQYGKVWAVASNRHQPSDNTPWIDGDVRMNFSRGVGIEMSTDMHAEAQLIAKAAREGHSLEGASLYVSTFPCPPCAMLIANSGIRKCYYAEGYAVLDGERVIKAAGIELIKVKMELPPDRAEVYRPYPEK